MSDSNTTTATPPSQVLSDGDSNYADKATDLERVQTSDFPDGGVKAWTVAAGAASAMFATFGFVNSFGIFQSYYKLHLLPNHTDDEIAWIGSIQAWLMFVTGAIAGPLSDRYGPWIVRPAAVFYLFGIMMTSLCTEYWQFMLAQGVVVGIGNGLVMFPTFSAVPQWFDKKRGAAMGMAVAGSSIGAIVLPILLSNLLTHTNLGFGWSVRIVGFVLVPFLIFTSLSVKARLPPRKTKFFLFNSLKKPMYVLLILASFFSMIGMFVPLFLIASYALSKGMTQTLAFYLVAVLNGASFFGRVIPGILGDRLGRINVFGLAAICTGIVSFCWPLASSTGGIVAVAIFFGFSSGAIISGSSTALTLCVDSPKDIGTYMGMGMALSSFAALVGPPVSGHMLDMYHGFHQVSYFSGSMAIVGGIIALGAKYFSSKGLFGRT